MWNLHSTVSLLAVLLLLAPVASALIADRDTAEAPTPVPAGFESWWTLGEKYADRFPLEPAPAGLSVEESVQHWLQERAMHGRTPTGWIEHVRDAYTQPAPVVLPEGKDLAVEVSRLYELVDVPLPALMRADLEARADALSPALRGPFAGFLSLVADGYAEQNVRALDILTRVHAGIDVESVVVLPHERDAMDALQARLAAAFRAFLDATQGEFPASGPGGNDPPVFTDPENLIYLGGSGDGTYGPGGGLVGDALLIVEPAGDDLYTNNAGGACPDALSALHRCNRLALAAVFDSSGNDAYRYEGVPAAVQGAGSTGGLGMLVDLEGDDEYRAHFVRGPIGPFFQYLDGGAQGFAQGGSALLYDGAGDDHYEITVRSTVGRSIWGFGQGFGSLGSLGTTIDRSGNDTWVGLGLGGVATDSHFQGLYPQGSGFYGGIGILLDLGLQDDTYHAYLEAETTDYYAQGFGAFGGLGIQYEEGGNDSYYAVEKAHNPWIDPLLNCAFGTGSLGGVGVFIDIRGDDSYHGDSIGPKPVKTMNEGFGGIGAAYGLHLDLGGDDDRVMLATGAPGSQAIGRGHSFQHGNVVGNFLDGGGNDTYVGPGTNNAVWLGGADQELPTGGLF